VVLVSTRQEGQFTFAPEDQSRMLLTIPIPESQQKVRLPPGTLDWSEDEFFRFCQGNHDLRIERATNGEISRCHPAEGYSS